VKRIRIVTALGVMGALACGGGGGDEGEETVLPACEPTQGVLPHAYDVVGMVGDYTLRLYAVSGDSAGRDATGELTLMQYADSLRELTTQSGPTTTTILTPLYGTADINLGAVNAVTQGSLDSSDPMSPGVVAIERHNDAGVELTLRLGSYLNARGQSLFDGAYTVLSAKWGTADRFGGSWVGGMLGSEAAGYFCADRRVEEKGE
jgi:hypothetical protein